MASFHRPLYGGAISCFIPEKFMDISVVRQVPDHQECWQDQSGNLLVIEIMEIQTSVPDEGAAEFFFNDLAECNGISSPRDLRFCKLDHDNRGRVHTEGLPPNATICLGKGYQKVAKGNDFDVFGNRRELSEAEWIAIELGLIRLPDVQTDLLVTLSSPNESNPQDPITHTELFRSIFDSLQIRDWSLFGAL